MDEDQKDPMQVLADAPLIWPDRSEPSQINCRCFVEYRKPDGAGGWIMGDE